MARREADAKDRENRDLHGRIDQLHEANSELRDKLEQTRNHESIGESEVTLFKRKAESARKEADLMRKQWLEMKVHAETLASKLAAKEKESNEEHKHGKTISVKRDESTSRELLMRELEVNRFHKIKELKQEKQYLETEIKNLKNKGSQQINTLDKSEVERTVRNYLDKIGKLETDNGRLEYELEVAKRELELSRTIQNKSKNR